MRISRTAAALAAAAVCAGGLAACGGDDDSNSGSTTTSAAAATTTSSTASSATSNQIDPSKPKVKLKLISFKIPASDLLTYFEAGAQGAVKAINAKGGFGGREVAIESCNSQLQAATSNICAQKTVRDDPVAEFGCELFWSSSGLAIYSKAGIPSLNCTNSKEDYSNPLSFGMTPSDTGQVGAQANWLCTRDDVKTVGLLKPNTPQIIANVPVAEKILKACGKTLEKPVFFPLEAVDVTPYVTKVLAGKPDFIMFSSINAQTVNFMKSFKQNGWPANKLVAPDTDFTYDAILKPAGMLMDGMYSAGQFDSWGDTSNPEVAQYLKDMQGSSVDPRDATVQWGYADVMWFYTAAQKIGFEQFDSASFAKFMNSATDVHFVLSRSLQNPGPPGYAQAKQPYAQIQQYQGNGKFTVVQGGDDGWFYGFGSKN